MFTLDENNDLNKTTRILPHRNNTGGFYIAKFRKINNFNEAEINRILEKYNLIDEVNGDK